MAISATELLGILPPRRIVGRVTKVVEGRVETYIGGWRNKAQSKAKRNAASRRYYWTHVEQIRKKSSERNKKKYWSNPEKWRAYHRKRMAGKLLREQMTPEQWRRRLDLHKAAKEKRDQDPAYRAARLAKQREYWHAKKARKA